ncbi:hypothetical protein HMPREF9141_2166 [Prevotella multiformis DSM 16608]|uniref:Uncharacterized protein n=1 Tax=Prevotella multiformis DSM 16608 TaxID=888743 RepID=F0F999_9BACT|nr:hypothetical protein HMPREF9141_2166 [Prevotella multiformis DSM 16608]
MLPASGPAVTERREHDSRPSGIRFPGIGNTTPKYREQQDRPAGGILQDRIPETE